MAGVRRKPEDLERAEMWAVYGKLRWAASDLMEQVYQGPTISGFEMELQKALDAVEAFHKKYPKNKRLRKS